MAKTQIRIDRACEKIAASAMRRPFYKRFVSIFGRAKTMRPVEHDPLRRELLRRGLSIDADTLLSVECRLAMMGVGRDEIGYAADYYQAYHIHLTTSKETKAMEYTKMQATLDRNEVSKEDMEKIWNNAKESNTVVKNLAEHGKNWTDLPEHLIDDLVNRYGTEA